MKAMGVDESNKPAAYRTRYMPFSCLNLLRELISILHLDSSAQFCLHDSFPLSNPIAHLQLMGLSVSVFPATSSGLHS